MILIRFRDLLISEVSHLLSSADFIIVLQNKHFGYKYPRWRRFRYRKKKTNFKKSLLGHRVDLAVLVHCQELEMMGISFTVFSHRIH